MKTIRYFIMGLATVLLASCMADSFDEPSSSGLAPYGNNALSETNVMSIAELKTQYSNIISSSGMELITKDIQIKGVVTANDIEGNIYNEIAIEDGTGAILICIAQGGLFGYLPVGQEILVSLKDLYIGGYGTQAEIGMPYTNKNGRTYVSRMSRALWNDHFKLMGQTSPTSVTPYEFDKSRYTESAYMTEFSGRLMVIRNVEFADADGTAVFAPEDLKDAANSVNRALKGYNSASLVVRTSSFSDFANSPMPQGKVNITGLFTRYNNTWQILLRSSSDIQAAE